MKVDRYGRITMTRHQICKLLLACTALEVMGEASAGSATEWRALHVELQEALIEYDNIRGAMHENAVRRKGTDLPK